VRKCDGHRALAYCRSATFYRIVCDVLSGCGKRLFFRSSELSCPEVRRELRRKVLALNGLSAPEESFLFLLHFSASCYVSTRPLPVFSTRNRSSQSTAQAARCQRDHETCDPAEEHADADQDANDPRCVRWPRPPARINVMIPSTNSHPEAGAGRSWTARMNSNIPSTNR
jgi:hypothetical protein